jgi:hypothetical protein
MSSPSRRNEINADKLSSARLELTRFGGSSEKLVNGEEPLPSRQEDRGSVEDAPAKEIEFGPATHAALQQLQLRDKAFRFPLAVGQSQSGDHRDPLFAYEERVVCARRGACCGCGCVHGLVCSTTAGVGQTPPQRPSWPRPSPTARAPSRVTPHLDRAVSSISAALRRAKLISWTPIPTELRSLSSSSPSDGFRVHSERSTVSRR